MRNTHIDLLNVKVRLVTVSFVFFHVFQETVL